LSLVVYGREAASLGAYRETPGVAAPDAGSHGW
jgi:hypothetical protein